MSNDYDRVSVELDKGTPAAVLCATCPWHRPCVQPPPMSRAEFQSRIRNGLDEDKTAGKSPHERATGALLMASVFGGQVTSGPMCPVFAQRLGGPDGRKIADVIRAAMNEC